MEQTLEQAAEEYVTSYPQCYNMGEIQGQVACKGFKDGAQWQRNSVWHSPSEEPENFPVLAVGFLTVRLFFQDDRIRFGAYDKWAYISDLLPNDKEG